VAEPASVSCWCARSTRLNDYTVIVVKVLRDRDIELDQAEMFVVARGVEQCPKADEEAHVLLIEARDTVNTGDAAGDLTAEPVEI
jgi:hypothetical protein